MMTEMLVDCFECTHELYKHLQALIIIYFFGIIRLETGLDG